MALMFSERLQKMRDATGTAYVEGEGFGEGEEGSVRFRDVFFFVIIVSPVEATSASSA